MGRINVLDKCIAELIAAGEVVERPASVVKELLENSIDAGADKITIEIKNGGNSLIKVSDNGCGIYRDDLKNAFLRHATSKVRTQSDLDSITTLGFRGEALASICAVSKVEVLTLAKDETVGTRYVIEGGEEKAFEDVGRGGGTTFIIRDLFFNTPARMKFLKKDVTEAGAIADIVDKVALSRPEVSTKLIKDGREIVNTPGDGKIDSCVYSIYGKEIFNNMIPISYELSGVKIDGFISRPENSRASRSLQNFFINSRYAKLKPASIALEEAFKGSIMVGKHPACAIYVNISPSAVDVNVHPAKTEVRFINEKPIFEAVYYAVKSALSKDNHKKEMFLSQNFTERAVQNVTPDSKMKKVSDNVPCTVSSGKELGLPLDYQNYTETTENDINALDPEGTSKTAANGYRLFDPAVKLAKESNRRVNNISKLDITVDDEPAFGQVNLDSGPLNQKKSGEDKKARSLINNQVDGKSKNDINALGCEGTSKAAANRHRLFDSAFKLVKGSNRRVNNISKLDITVDDEPAFEKVNLHSGPLNQKKSDGDKNVHSLINNQVDGKSKNDIETLRYEGSSETATSGHHLFKPAVKLSKESNRSVNNISKLDITVDDKSPFAKKLDRETYNLGLVGTDLGEEKLSEGQEVTEIFQEKLPTKNSDDSSAYQTDSNFEPSAQQIDNKCPEPNNRSNQLGQENFFETSALKFPDSQSQNKSFKKILGEVFKCYIVVQDGEDNLLFIDKHAAHERIIYNNLKKSGQGVDSQILLKAVTVTLSKKEYAAVLDNVTLFSESGYCVEDFGSGCVIVRSAPVWLPLGDIQDSVIEIANYIIKNKMNLDISYMDWLYHNIACRAAVKAGTSSSPEEIQQLVRTLSENPNIMYCPHGRPIYISLNKKYIEKQFGRT